jgi:tRNA(Arg) A34 adenosine deaminase TadA
MPDDNHWMRIAIDACLAGVAAGQTPFGAAVVRGDELVAAAHNVVWETTDVTGHAEVNAIRLACRKLGTIDLSGCRIYSTTEPCPMCFAACHWARLGRIVYGASIADAAAAGFHELTISNEQMRRLGGSGVEVVGGVLRGECEAIFEQWKNLLGRKAY